VKSFDLFVEECVVVEIKAMSLHVSRALGVLCG
jgi:hypothetical protein